YLFRLATKSYRIFVSKFTDFTLLHAVVARFQEPVASYEHIQEETREINIRNDADQDAENHRKRKTFNRSVTNKIQHGSGYDARNISVHNRTERALGAGLQGRKHAFARPDLLLDPLCRNNIGVHRHPDTED